MCFHVHTALCGVTNGKGVLMWWRMWNFTVKKPVKTVISKNLILRIWIYLYLPGYNYILTQKLTAWNLEMPIFFLQYFVKFSFKIQNSLMIFIRIQNSRTVITLICIIWSRFKACTNMNSLSIRVQGRNKELIVVVSLVEYF